MAPWPRTDRPRLRLLLLALALLPAPAQGETAQLRFERHGEPVAAPDLAQLREAVQPSEVRVFEPYEGREVTFRALPFSRVLDRIYGEGWRGEEEILFRCRDGYRPTVPVRRVREHRAWLAFDRADQDAFRIRKRESGEHKDVELGPFYLVWENLDDATLRQEADYGWPYQLVGVDLIRTRDHFGAMAPPPDAGDAARRGFDAFRVHCSKCHRIHGQGGEIGPPLDPASVAARDRAWLRAWIVDPSRIAPKARMPALNPALPDREGVVAAIVAYLESLAPAGEAAP